MKAGDLMVSPLITVQANASVCELAKMFLKMFLQHRSPSDAAAPAMIISGHSAELTSNAVPPAPVGRPRPALCNHGNSMIRFPVNRLGIMARSSLPQLLCPMIRGRSPRMLRRPRFQPTR